MNVRVRKRVRSTAGAMQCRNPQAKPPRVFKVVGSDLPGTGEMMVILYYYY